MEVKLWEGGLQSQEIKAIESIQEAFSAKPISSRSKSASSGSLKDQLRSLGGNPILPWKGYAGFRFVDAKGNEGEFDLVIVTHCNVLIIELKDWNNGEVVSCGDRWYKNDVDMGRSPVSVTQNKVYLLKNKLDRIRNKFSNDGRTPFIHHLVLMTGNARFEKIRDQEKSHTLSLAEFLEFSDEDIFNKKFRPHPKAKVLNQDFDVFDKLFLGNNTAPKHIRIDGYKATALIFEHPRKVYKEFQAVSEISRGDEALLRLWNFDKLDGVKAKTTDGRFAIVSREREVLQFIKHQDHDLYKHCLRSLTSVQKDEVTTEYSEVYELPPNHARFNEFIGKYGPSFSDSDRSNLMKLLVAKFADLHQINVAHRDLGDHSIWISPSKEVALSNFISAYHKPVGTVGDYRQLLSVNDVCVAAGQEAVETPYEADVYALGLISWHILTAQRISPKSVDSIERDLEQSEIFYAPVILRALQRGFFSNATEFFDALKEAEPVDESQAVFDQSELEPYRKSINHSRQFREDDEFLVETEEREIYLSNGQIVKAWLNIGSIDNSDPAGYKLLHFLRRIEKLKTVSPPYIPCIREFGIATKSSSLYLVMDKAEGFHWNDLDINEEDKLVVIKKLIESVEHLHTMHIPHGDLHPGNVIVGQEGGEYFLSLIDIPDYCEDSAEMFNHRYSPDNIDTCTAFERDNFAVMRMACELLGLRWGEESSEYEEIANAVDQELTDSLYGFKDLSRFKSVIDAPESDLVEPVKVMLRGDFEPVTIYPDNGHLYLQIESSKKERLDARVRIFGIGGSVDLIFSTKDRAFVVGFKPRVRSSIRRSDADNSHLELDFPISIAPGRVHDLSELSKRLESNESFILAVDLALKEDVSEVVAADDLTLEMKNAFERLQQEKSEQSEPQLKISTANLWKAILETETESYPYIEVSGSAREVKDSKDQLIIPYRADIDALGHFSKSDCIEALTIVGEKETPIGEVILKQSALNEVRLSKLRFKAHSLSEGDLVFFRTKQDRASYEKRKAALKCLLDKEGVISDLVSYFDPACTLPAITYDIVVSEDDFSRYDRTDDQGNKISLNDQQRGAFQRLIRNGPVSLLQGPPGTGKTEFIAAFVHYLIEKQSVQRVLLVSQSHEAVNTAAERIRNHCARLETKLEVVRFSNREGAVSTGLKDVYSNSIIAEKRELFRAEARHRVAALGRALGLQPRYLSDLVSAELKLFRQIDHFNSSMKSLIDHEMENEDEKQLKKSLLELDESIRGSLQDEFGIDLGKDENHESAKQRVIEKLNRDYAVRPDESLRAKALAKVSRDMLDVLETDEVNYDEFLARSRQLVTGTCVGIGQRHIGIRENQYDWVIIDEAARSIASELAIAMQAGKRILLVGDHQQLPPLYTAPHKKALARRLGISSVESDLDIMLQSDFARAFESSFGDHVGATLLTQYRMAPEIGNLVSNAFYDGKLENGDRVIPEIYSHLPEVLQSPVTWMDTSGLGHRAYHQADKGVSIYNRCEADLIINLLKQVAEDRNFVYELKSLVKEEEPAIGVICMYGEQKRLLRQKFNEVQWDEDFRSLVKIDTVDSYQGKENRIIILSLTRSDQRQSPGFLRAPNRINVALSRAMDRLLIVGSVQMWRSNNKRLPLGRVSSFMEEKGQDGGYRFVTSQVSNDQGVRRK
ncbi:AAA domain-containing protein [uncultured Porticoccus sp.]|uniref:AAA domain-containing protein n=1 Tax=uncultured Porticoccus sp. TaxID=1256050 RepID=UPI0026100283|nr:AAA domain-containing protein [uncultured Porticoccus sp.]